MWEEFGFTENPYSHRPISADDQGARLLIGREAELAAIIRRITSFGPITTIEGPNGVGKTSVASVAAHQLWKEFQSGVRAKCFLPAREQFQFSQDGNAQELINNVYRQVLLTLHGNRKSLAEKSLNIGETDKLEKWLSYPQYSGIGGGFGGASVSTSTSPNESEGFSELGFNNAVQSLLDHLFPSPNSGGVICTLDNQELLEQSRRAREALEYLRDTLFDRRGLVWVICGAKGIVRSAASSQRLQGVLSDPLRIAALEEAKLDGLIEARISEFSRKDKHPTPPVTEAAFKHLFKITNANLRNALKFCGDFSIWLADRGDFALGQQENYELLQIWLAEKADEYSSDAKAVTQRTWDVFDGIVTRGGSCAPGDFEEFSFESQQAMRPHIKRLEESNLVDSVIDDEDYRRKTISITSLGWIVNYSRNGYPI